MSKPMMKCGHAANATNGEGKPVCVICIGIKPGAIEVDTTPSLAGRQAQCVYDKTICPSDSELPFFESTPDKPFDSFYCGCRGWD